MIYWIIGIVTFIVLVYSTRYIVISDRGSLIGIIASKSTRVASYLIRNNRKKLKEKMQKINKKLKWEIKEGDFRKYSIKRIDIDGLEASMLTPKNSKNDHVMLQLHGGGYEADLVNNNLYFAKKYARYSKGFDILTINYRVAPENKYPAALEDAVKAYNYLINKKGYNSNNVIIVGDSAGGGLALATAMYLRDNNIALPCGIITMSAWTDLTNEEKSFKDNFYIDPIFGYSKNSILITSRYAEGMNKKEPYISPIYGSFKDFPDVLMQVGSHEMLLSDSIEVAKKMRKEGIDVILTIYNGMFHNFQRYNNIIPEADRAWREIRDFIRGITKR